MSFPSKSRQTSPPDFDKFHWLWQQENCTRQRLGGGNGERNNFNG